MRRTLAPVLAALLAAAAVPALAQDTIPRRVEAAALPPHVADRIIDFFNDPETIHFTGATRIPAERTVGGDVAVLDAPLTVAGRIDGDVVVINGDLELLDGAAITGDVIVVGGAVTGDDLATVGGELVAYSEPLEYRRRGDRIAARRRDHDDDEGEWVIERNGRREGRADFVVATGQSYNRVEGLPITFGPVLETAGSNPFRLRAMGIYRTETGPVLQPDRWGYEVKAEQFLGGHRAFRVGASVFSRIDPIEDWHVSKLENGLSTFFLHRDFRDHFEREGWSVFARLTPRGGPLDATLSFRSEEHESQAAGSPWTIFNNDDPWRLQPLVGHGRLNSLVLETEIDTRNDEDEPSTGWYLAGEVEQALDAELERPEAFWVNSPLPVFPGPVVPAREYGAFTRGMVDLRRYNRISASSRLNFRLLAGGSLDGSALPPQRQHALGGEGSLPGFALFSVDCGARDRRLVRTGGDIEEEPQFYEAYGCDRFVLGQAEYRGSLSFRFDVHDWHDHDDEDDDEEWDDGDHDIDADFGWVLFADVGRGWALDPDFRDEETAADVGLGVLLGRLGVYAAFPVSDGVGEPRFFIRLNPRF
jgi:surface antigen Omp85-like protein